ncbi:peptide/nickel transport system substrate-binding protein [Thalassobacillus cyri]|uniref:Peptide/nickel transport system substrate-binding protein n=1 Tax=Thalassobacillus cyri TaxID=571932 RepID=A0A1H4AK34_9BACI|nr:ABC transporter substrate-binding protein [Thalassobacillus cyri]SEA36171.1 peptide/nickel transport system substrate-binding protein [Thalassobacillus cyri]
MKKNWMALLMGIVMATLLLSACSNEGSSNEADADGGSGEAATEQVLKIGNDQEPAGLDPHKVPAHSSIRIYEKIYDSLLTFDEDMKVQPELAEKWEQPDETTYVFTLREGVKFHNGREMTAEDVKYSFERIMDEETASIAKSYFDKVESIEVVSPTEIKFTLSEPYAPFLSYVASTNAAIVAKEVVEENGDLNQAAVGTGPFKLDEWLPDNHVKLSKNEDYYKDGQPKLDGITYLTMKDESARLAAIRTGEVHVTTLSSQSIPLAEKSDGVEIKSYQSTEYSYVGFNVNKEPFNDVKVRQAISLAVDRKEVADVVWKGDAVLSGPIPESMGQWAIDVSQEELYQQNIEKAKELLAEAGYEDGFETVISTASTYTDMVDTAQLLQQQLEAIGIKAEIKQLEWGQYIDTWTNGDHDMLVGRNSSGSDPDRSIGFFFSTDGSANVWGFSDEKIDQLAEEGRTTIDPEKRVEIYNEAQKRVIEQTPNLFLVSPEKFFIVRDSVDNYSPTANEPENFNDVVIME